MRLLTLARDLRRRKSRERHALFVAEGIRTVEELLRSPLPIVGALASPQLGATPRGAALREVLRDRDIELLDVPERDFDSAADTESPQGILAIAAVPRHGPSELDALVPAARSCRVLVLDALQDPGNVGTILRTAAALGVTATIALPGTVDVWNAKVVRSAMGAHFHHVTVSCTWDEFDAFRSRAALPLWGADAHGAPLDTIVPPERLAIAVGNEGGGLGEQVRTSADQLVALRIAADVESLNVAVATGILLYALRQ